MNLRNSLYFDMSDLCKVEKTSKKKKKKSSSIFRSQAKENALNVNKTNLNENRNNLAKENICKSYGKLFDKYLS